MTVCNPIDADFPVGWIDILPSSPPGIVLTPPSIDLTANPIVAGECRSLNVVLSGSNIVGEEFYYNLLAHSMDPAVDTALCCSLDTMYCITIPDCNPCDDIGVESVEPVQEGDGLCCYDITLFNNFDVGTFDGIGICTLDPDNSLSMYNPFGSGWVTTAYTPNMITLGVSPPLGTSIPLGSFSLPELCIETNSAPPQLLEIKWLSSDSVVCRDTVEGFCEPPCGYVSREKIRCDDVNGGWRYQVIIKNTSNFTISEANFAFTSPPGMSSYNFVRDFGTGLSPGNTASTTFNLGSPAMPGDTLCFTVAMHAEDDDGNHTECCNFEHCIVLPDCPLDPGPQMLQSIRYPWQESGDDDGRDETEGPWAIPTNSISEEAPSVYPNPSSGSLFLRFNQPIESEEVRVMISDVYGHIYPTQYLKDVHPGSAIPLATEHLTKGIYWVKIESGSEQHVHKIVIQ